MGRGIRLDPPTRLFFKVCGQGGNRTPDAQIFSLSLYRLSYLPAFYSQESDSLV